MLRYPALKCWAFISHPSGTDKRMTSGPKPYPPNPGCCCTVSIAASMFSSGTSPSTSWAGAKMSPPSTPQRSNCSVSDWTSATDRGTRTGPKSVQAAPNRRHSRCLCRLTDPTSHRIHPENDRLPNRRRNRCCCRVSVGGSPTAPQCRHSRNEPEVFLVLLS